MRARPELETVTVSPEGSSTPPDSPPPVYSWSSVAAGRGHVADRRSAPVARRLRCIGERRHGRGSVRCGVDDDVRGVADGRRDGARRGDGPLDVLRKEMSYVLPATRPGISTRSPGAAVRARAARRRRRSPRTSSTRPPSRQRSCRDRSPPMPSSGPPGRWRRWRVRRRCRTSTAMASRARRWRTTCTGTAPAGFGSGLPGPPSVETDGRGDHSNA